MRLHDEICDELCNEDEFSDDSDCDSGMVVKFLSDSEQTDSSDDEDNVNDDNDMQHGTWTKVGAERLRVLFSGKLGLNVHLEDPNNLLDHFELLITPEVTDYRLNDRGSIPDRGQGFFF
jgi:hypothetical protein